MGEKDNPVDRSLPPKDTRVSFLPLKAEERDTPTDDDGKEITSRFSRSMMEMKFDKPEEDK